MQLSSTSSCRCLEAFEWEVYFTSQRPVRISQPKNSPKTVQLLVEKAWGFRAGKTCKTSPQRPRSSEKPWHPGLHLSIFGLGRVHDSCPNIKNSNIFEMPQTPVVFFCNKNRRRKTPEPSKYFTRARLSRWW